VPFTICILPSAIATGEADPDGCGRRRCVVTLKGPADRGMTVPQDQPWRCAGQWSLLRVGQTNYVSKKSGVYGVRSGCFRLDLDPSDVGVSFFWKLRGKCVEETTVIGSRSAV
jgi:hypothetical protein